MEESNSTNKSNWSPCSFLVPLDYTVSHHLPQLPPPPSGPPLLVPVLLTEPALPLTDPLPDLVSPPPSPSRCSSYLAGWLTIHHHVLKSTLEFNLHHTLNLLPVSSGSCLSLSDPHLYLHHITVEYRRFSRKAWNWLKIQSLQLEFNGTYLSMVPAMK